MITANVGRSFLNHYNTKNGLDLSPKEIFEKVFIPLFYDHPQYLMVGGNTPLENPKIQWKEKKFPSEENRRNRISALIAKIDDGVYDTRTAMDAQASEINGFATTSGQVTDLKIEINLENVYCSWIGISMGIGVSGSQVILFDNSTVFDVLFQGWQVYRDFLNDPAYSGLSGNKINSWNGQWLSHVLGKNYSAEDPLQNFSGLETNKEGNIQVVVQSWLKIILAIARKVPQPSMTGYIYKHGQTNSTFGFIPFNLKTIRYPSELYTKLFGEYAYQRDSKIVESLYGSGASFQRICQMGAIGIAALEPTGLKEIMKGTKSFKFDDKRETQITFNTYITWLLAMLNNDEFWDEAGKAAEMLHRYATFTKRAKDLGTSKSSQVDNLFEATSKPKLLSELALIIKNSDESFASDLENLAFRFHKLPNDNFQYFKTLVLLRYSALSKSKSTETIQ